MSEIKDEQTKGKKKLTYTMILHQPRMKLGLTMIEYAVCDAIYHLQNNSKHRGWCYGSKDYLAKCLGITERHIYRIIDTVKSKNLIEVDPETHFVRTTNLWYEAVILWEKGDHDKMSYPMTLSHSDHDKMSVGDHDKMSYNNNSIDNNNINTFPSPLPSSQKTRSDELVNGSRKGRKGKGNVDSGLFERLRSGIYRNDLFTMYDNLLWIRSIEQLAGDAAYKAIKSVLVNNEEFLRQEYGTNYSKFPKEEMSEVVAKRFPYGKLPDSSDEDARRKFFVSAVCNTVAEVMTETLGGMREVETANKKPRINHRR